MIWLVIAVRPPINDNMSTLRAAIGDYVVETRGIGCLGQVITGSAHTVGLGLLGCYGLCQNKTRAISIKRRGIGGDFCRCT